MNLERITMTDYINMVYRDHICIWCLKVNPDVTVKLVDGVCPVCGFDSNTWTTGGGKIWTIKIEDDS